LQVFLDFRYEVITRRTQYELRKAEERDHLLQGLLIALNHLDAVIGLIRGADDSSAAKSGLIESYGLSEAQADAILAMQLRRLTAQDADKIHDEHDQLVLKIADLLDILQNRDRILTITREELEAVKAEFATPRRSRILPNEGDIDTADLIANRETIVMVTEQGYVKRMPVDTFTAQHRATRGKASANVKDSDAIAHFFACRSHDRILFFTDRGKVYGVKAYEIPESGRAARGTAVVQLLPIAANEKITTVLPISEFCEDEYLVMLTAGGYIKKTKLPAFANIRANGLIAIALEDGDELRWVRRAKADNTIIVGSRQGMSIRFRTNHEQLRPMGRDTRGVRSMRMTGDDEIVSMDIIPAGLAEVEADEIEEEIDITAIDVAATVTEDENLESEPEIVVDEKAQGPWVLVVTRGGYGKRVPVNQFRIQKRAGKGLRVTKFKSGQDQLASLCLVDENNELMIVTSRGIVMRQSTDAIARQSRTARGVRLQKLDASDAIVGATLVPPALEEEIQEVEILSGDVAIAATEVITEAIALETEE
jgi:DNA gyrase subunit A